MLLKEGGNCAEENEGDILETLSMEDRLLLDAVACMKGSLQDRLSFIRNPGNRDLVYQFAGFHRHLDEVLPDNSVRLLRRRRYVR